MRFCGGMIAFITFIRHAAAAMAANTAKETIVASARVRGKSRDKSRGKSRGNSSISSTGGNSIKKVNRRF